MIVDSLIFFNEFDLLEIRLNELKDVVDIFVITEATLTHRGDEKPLYFDDNKERFSEFNIEHVTVNDYTGVNLSAKWDIEMHQRQCGVDHIKKMNLKEKDVVLLSDCDEIWDSQAVKECANTNGWNIAGTYMYMFCYYLNCFRIDEAWFQPRWVKGDSLNINPIRGATVKKKFYGAGWHFSYLGDIQEKLASFAHFEYDRPPYNTTEYIEQRRSNGQSLFNDTDKYSIVKDLGYLPQYILDNMDRFKKYICWD